MLMLMFMPASQCEEQAFYTFYRRVFIREHELDEKGVGAKREAPMSHMLL